MAETALGSTPLGIPTAYRLSCIDSYLSTPGGVAGRSLRFLLIFLLFLDFTTSENPDAVKFSLLETYP